MSKKLTTSFRCERVAAVVVGVAVVLVPLAGS